jgi:hypothetical protein
MGVRLVRAIEVTHLLLLGDLPAVSLLGDPPCSYRDRLSVTNRIQRTSR